MGLLIFGYIGYRCYQKNAGNSSGYKLMQNDKLLETKDQPL